MEKIVQLGSPNLHTRFSEIDDPVALGRALEGTMSQRGWSQRKLAAEADISATTIRNALAFARAADGRAGYARNHGFQIDADTDIGELSVRQVHHLVTLTPEDGHAWLAAGAKVPKVGPKAAGEGAKPAAAHHETPDPERMALATQVAKKLFGEVHKDTPDALQTAAMRLAALEKTELEVLDEMPSATASTAGQGASLSDDEQSALPGMESIAETTVPPATKPDDDDGFEIFWESVPRRVGKKAAHRAYKTALRKADTDTLLQGIKAYTVQVAEKEAQYVKHPSSWLNGEHWLDEDLPSASQPGGTAETDETGKYVPRAVRERQYREGRVRSYLTIVSTDFYGNPIPFWFDNTGAEKPGPAEICAVAEKLEAEGVELSDVGKLVWATAKEAAESGTGMPQPSSTPPPRQKGSAMHEAWREVVRAWTEEGQPKPGPDPDQFNVEWERKHGPGKNTRTYWVGYYIRTGKWLSGRGRDTQPSSYEIDEFRQKWPHLCAPRPLAAGPACGHRQGGRAVGLRRDRR